MTAPITTQQPASDESDEIAQLARAFCDLVPDHTSDRVVCLAALSFICALADFSPNRKVMADLMHSAADELVSSGARFQSTSH